MQSLRVVKVDNKLMKAIIYCRVSTTKSDQQTSLERQNAELNQLARQYNLEVRASISEQASGYEIEREGIFTILEHFMNEEAQYLLIQDETRLGRGNAKIALIHELQKLNVSILTSINESELELSEGDSMVLQIISAVEEYQRKVHNIKIKRGMQRAISRGYNPAKNLGDLTNSPGRSRLKIPMDQIIDLREKGLTFDEITEKLKLQGHTISRATVHRRYQEYKNS